MGVVVYTSSASASSKIKKEQKAITDYLKANKIDFTEIDLCVHTDALRIMREKIPEDRKPKEGSIMIPQVFNDDVYCGGYESFFNAREMEALCTFFKIPPTPAELAKRKLLDKENDPNAENAAESDVAKAEADSDGTEPANEVSGEKSDAGEADKKGEETDEKDGEKDGETSEKDKEKDANDAGEDGETTDKKEETKDPASAEAITMETDSKEKPADADPESGQAESKGDQAEGNQ